MASAAMSKREYEALSNRMRRLPDMLHSARLKVLHLEREALRYGMKELLEDPKLASDAFEREVRIAKILAGEE